MSEPESGEPGLSQDAIAERINDRINTILNGALSGMVPRYRHEKTSIRWGLVEREIRQAVREELDRASMLAPSLLAACRRALAALDPDTVESEVVRDAIARAEGGEAR